MRGFGPTAYGDGFADVYDDWYSDVSDVDSTVALMVECAGPGGSVLELGVGTGRLALPLARAGLAVTGLDASTAMLDRLRERDPEGLVRTVTGDMANDLPDGPFDAVLIAYNTLFNLVEDGEQQRCLAAAAARLSAGGAIVVEAAIPDDPFPDGDDVRIRSMTATELVLTATRYERGRRLVVGQHVQLADGEPVRIRPWMARLATVAELDAMATEAGLTVARRWADTAGTPFDGTARHVTVYEPLRESSGAVG